MRSQGRRDRLLFGLINPHSRRSVLVLLGVGTVACAVWLSNSRASAAEQFRTRPGVVIGHQAFQAAFHRDNAASSSAIDEQASVLEGWLEDEFDESAFDGTVEDPQRLVAAPITDITVRSCVVSPYIVDVCAPKTTMREEAVMGRWTRLNKDINKRIGMYYLYIYVRRRLPSSRVPVITDIKLDDSVLDAFDLETTAGSSWLQADTSVRTALYPSLPAKYLRYRLTEQNEIDDARRANGGDAGDLEPITGLDVLYGDDTVQPLPGYTRMDSMITGGQDDPKRQKPNGKGSRPGVTLAYRKKLPKTVPKPQLYFNRRGKYRILQVADLHLSVGPGDCRDVDPSVKAECQEVGADRYSLQWLERALDTSKPDLVVLTGDQINGQVTSWSSASVIMKYAPLIYSRKIAWTAIFGNHDREDDLSNAEQMTFMTRLPYFVGEAGPDSVEGVGNYVLSVKSFDSTNTTLMHLYFLDSHAQLKSINPFQKSSYDYIRPSQVNWFKSMSNQVKPIDRPYVPAQDFINPHPAGGASDIEEGDEAQQATPPKLPFGLDEVVNDASSMLNDAGDKMSALVNGGGDGAYDDRARRVIRRQAKKRQGDRVDAPDGFLPEVIDDGTRVHDDDPNPAPTFESADDSGLDPFSIQQAEELLEPTRMPAGPTRANPMQAKPNAIAFFHIPLPEQYDWPIDVRKSGHERFRVGERLEGYGASKKNGQFFELGLVGQRELVPGLKDDNGAAAAAAAAAERPVDGFWEADSWTEGRPEVKVVANGHCHVSSDCRRTAGIWMCFGGGESYSGYGKPSFERRVRVFDVSDYGETIETYLLLDKSGEKDRVVLVGENAME